jgi:hypothetical protein
MLIVAVGAFQAQAHHLSIVRPFLGSMRQPGNDPLDLLALCRILNSSGYGFKISEKALSFVGHDTSLRKLQLCYKRREKAFNHTVIEIIRLASGGEAGSSILVVLIGPVPPPSCYNQCSVCCSFN